MLLLDERCVDTAEDYERTAITRYLADFIPAQGILGMNADADDIARLNVLRIYMLRVSSTRIECPKKAGVAAAITYIQRGVMTAVPKDEWLGLIRWTFICGSWRRQTELACCFLKFCFAGTRLALA